VDIVLGVSMTPTTVRMVLVEGDRADGVTVDHDSFDITSNEGSANSAAADQVVEAVLGTQESAATGGHHLTSIGVTWSDHSEASALRDALAAKGLDDVMLISAGHAAAALAQAVGRAVGYDTTALFFIDRDTATLSVVQTDDGSVVKVLSRSLHSDDAMAVLTEMAAAVDEQDAPPQGMFVVGSGVDVTSVKQHLQHLVSLPVNAPEEPELALARGAALAAANAPALEASTVGLAYSQDPDGTTAGTALAGLANAETQMAPVGSDGAFADDYESLTDMQPVEGERKPFLLVGSALTSIFVVGVVALVISLAVSIRPTADQRPSPGESALAPSTAAPAAPAPAPVPVPEAQPIVEPPAPPAQTIKPPVPVVQEAPQAPPRTVYVESPPPAQAVAPAPAAPPPVPVAPAPVPIPAAPVYIPPPAYNPPSIFSPRPWQPSWQPPIYTPQTPVYTPQTPTYSPPTPSWNPPWEQPEEPQVQQPQSPQQVPSWQNGGGSNGSSRGGSDDSSSRGGSGFPGSSGRGGGGGGSNCFLVFCR
jgi:uncharacterized membrane protein YgcG